MVALLLLADLAVLLHLFLPDRGGLLVALFHAAPLFVHGPTPILMGLAAWRGRRWWIGLPSLVLLLWLLLPAPGTSTGPARWTFATHNALVVAEDPEAQARRWLTQEVDVLFVQELSPALAAGFEAPELQERFPYRSVHPSRQPFGMGLYSRIPLETVTVDADHHGLRAELDGLVLYGMHVPPPFSDHLSTVRTERIQHLAVQVAAEDAPVVVLGDLNTGPDSPLLRHLRHAGGLTDAVAACGPLWSATWSRRGLPRLLQLDHVLLRGLSCTDVEVLPRLSSDHAPVTVGLRAP